MGKHLGLGCLTFTLIVCLASCNNELDLSKYNVAHSNVYARYETNAVITYDSEFDLEGIVFRDSTGTGNIVSSLIPGDELDIYYLNNIVEHVFVDKATIVQISIEIGIAPGNDEIEMFTDEIGIVIDSSKIEYIICEDSSYVSISDYSDFDVFYGTYNPANNIQTTQFTTLVQLDAVYSCSPR
jgi:hypothetical protein